MRLRRALLWFAITFGVVVLVASLSSSPQRDGGGGSEQPVERGAGPPADRSRRDGEGRIRVRFSAEGGVRRERVSTGRPVTVTVSVREPGDVQLEGLGLISPADRLTPARFDVLPREPRRHAVRFTAAGEREPSTVGVLVVQAESRDGPAAEGDR